MGLVTDQQKMAYVLKPRGDRSASRACAESVRPSRSGWVEIILEELESRRRGPRRERASRRSEASKKASSNSVYPHAQGNWVHGAGAWVSYNWPERYGQHPRELVRHREIWSIEYSTSREIDEWDGQSVSMLREEDGWVGEDGVVRYFAGPQPELWLIRSDDN